jgi:hypothetical protein
MTSKASVTAKASVRPTDRLHALKARQALKK